MTIKALKKLEYPPLLNRYTFYLS